MNTLILQIASHNCLSGLLEFLSESDLLSLERSLLFDDGSYDDQVLATSFRNRWCCLFQFRSAIGSSCPLTRQEGAMLAEEDAGIQSSRFFGYASGLASSIGSAYWKGRVVHQPTVRKIVKQVSPYAKPPSPERLRAMTLTVDVLVSNARNTFWPPSHPPPPSYEPTDETELHFRNQRGFSTWMFVKIMCYSNQTSEELVLCEGFCRLNGWGGNYYTKSTNPMIHKIFESASHKPFPELCEWAKNDLAEINVSRAASHDVQRVREKMVSLLGGKNLGIVVVDPFLNQRCWCFGQKTEQDLDTSVNNSSKYRPSFSVTDINPVAGVEVPGTVWIGDNSRDAWCQIGIGLHNEVHMQMVWIPDHRNWEE